MQWGSETINTVKFNQTETSVLASCGSDRSVILYDIRTSKPVSKVIMKVFTNNLHNAVCIISLFTRIIIYKLLLIRIIIEANHH